jgi:tetratricopeptide (TPR) repeat protein
MASDAHPADIGESAGTNSCVDIPPETQTMIREFAQTLPRKNYYEVLDVPSDADDGAIRDAFFEYSKQFHPDRYFRKRLGPYEGLLTEIYKRIVLAHEVLRDPNLRKEYDKGINRSSPPPPETTSSPEPPPKTDSSPTSPPRRAGPSLRSRPGLRSRTLVLQRLEQHIQTGRRKAREKFDEAMAQRDQGDWVRALSLVRLAMAFDPREAQYHEAMAELLPRANSEQAVLVAIRAEELMSRGKSEDALSMFEELFKLRPTDSEAAYQVAVLAQEVSNDLAKAREFAERAVSLDEDDSRYRKMLGRLYKEAGLNDKARREFQRAWELDPLDKEAKAELQDL